MVSFRTEKSPQQAPLMILTLEPVGENPHRGDVRCRTGNKIVAVWRVNTKKYAPPDRMSELITTVEAAWPKMLALGGSNDVNENNNTKSTDVSSAFVAPEYLFTANDCHFMGEQTKEANQVQFAALLMPWEINVF
jgi:hypothetical protein